MNAILLIRFSSTLCRCIYTSFNLAVRLTQHELAFELSGCGLTGLHFRAPLPCIRVRIIPGVPCSLRQSMANSALREMLYYAGDYSPHCQITYNRAASFCDGSEDGSLGPGSASVNTWLEPQTRLGIFNWLVGASHDVSMFATTDICDFITVCVSRIPVDLRFCLKWK